MVINNDLCGVVVLYNPSAKVLSNIDSYLNHVSLLYVVENSEYLNLDIVRKLLNNKKIIYISNKENMGIAYALNMACNAALNSRKSWILTMDQDSYFSDKNLEKYVDFCKTLQDKKYGAIGPNFSSKPIFHQKKLQLVKAKVLITSGMMLNLEAYLQVGPFDEKLFIDSVDYEYCLRLSVAGWKIGLLKEIFLKHELGECVEKKLFFFRMKLAKHSPLRKYYMVRNSLYLWSKYFTKAPFFIVLEILKTYKLFLELFLLDTEKSKTLEFMKLGLIDFFKGRFGKFKGNIL